MGNRRVVGLGTRWLLILGVVLLLASFSAAAQSSGTHPGKADKLPYFAEEVSFPALISSGSPDTLTIRATLYLPRKPKAKRSPVVLLIHMLGRDRRTWLPLIPELTEAGYATLALDLRGHGDSDKLRGKTFADFSSRDWVSTRLDIKAALDFIATRRELNPKRIGLIGASIGANLALLEAATNPNVRVAVLMSPGLDYRGIRTGRAAAAYPSKALLIMASRGDTYSAESSKNLFDLARHAEPKKLKLYPGTAHGTNLLTTQPGSIGLIMNWLLNNLLFE